MNIPKLALSFREMQKSDLDTPYQVLVGCVKKSGNFVLLKELNMTGITFITDESYDEERLQDLFDVFIAESRKDEKCVSWKEVKKIIDERLNDYYKNPANVIDFDKTLDDIEKTL